MTTMGSSGRASRSRVIRFSLIRSPSSAPPSSGDGDHGVSGPVSTTNNIPLANGSYVGSLIADVGILPVGPRRILTDC